MDGKNKICVKQSNKFIKIKYENEENVGVNRDEQSCIYGNEILNEYLIGYQICDVPVIKNAYESGGEMKIFIKTIDDKILTFEMEHSNKIRDVKMKIDKKTKLSADKQNLFFQGEILNDDDKTIDEYQICEKSVINVVARLRGGMQIFAKINNGVIVTFEVQRTERVIDLKKKIQDKIGLSPDEQKLVYQGVLLEDNKTVDEYQICEKSVIDIVARLRDGMQIYAKTMDGKTVAFRVQRTERVIDIKKKIQDKIGLSPDEQKFVYKGGILEDNKTVDEYQICEKSVINVVARLRGSIQIFAKTMDGMQIFAKTIDGKTVAFEVQKSDKIIDLKYKIQDKIGLHPDEQKWFYQDEILNYDNKTIDEYQICEKSVIDIVARLRLLLVVQTKNGKTIALEVQKSDKIIDIRKKVQEKLGLQDEKQLIYEGRLMNDDKTIDQYQICDKSVINIDI